MVYMGSLAGAWIDPGLTMLWSAAQASGRLPRASQAS